MSYFDSCSLKIVSDQRQQELRWEADSERLAKSLPGGRQPWWRRLFSPRPTVIAASGGDRARAAAELGRSATTMVARAI